MTTPSIAIVGAGFSGTLLSIHLLRQAPPGTHIRLIERGDAFGPGRAYSTENPNHLLNVPAGCMSAFPDQPLDFLQWLQRRPAHELGGDVPRADSFVPRRLYGAYIQSLLSQALREQQSSRLELMRGSVRSIADEPQGLTLHLDRGPSVTADIAVLALGNFAPEPPRVADGVFHNPDLYASDPWSPDAMAGLDPEAPVLLIGTGSTAVDMVISLLDQGHVGPIHAMSPTGLLPRSHAAISLGLSPEPLPAYPAGLRELLHFMRQESARHVAAGGNWRVPIDGLRPLTQDIWQTMTREERGRFLRHLRAWWDVYRHRIAPQTAERIATAQTTGQLRVHAGRIRGYHPAEGKLAVRYRLRGGDRDSSMNVARAVNCSGPCSDYERIGDPLVQSLLSDGHVRPDALRLGLDVTDTCALRSGAGVVSQRLFAVGPATRGALWEITAVPDLRRQCEAVARTLTKLVMHLGLERSHSFWRGPGRWQREETITADATS